MACTGFNTINPICHIKHIGSNIASDAFGEMADWFAKAAESAVNGLWHQIGAATTINLDSEHLATDLKATGAIALVLCLGLFCIQGIASVLRRDPGGLGRAVKGLLVALVASVFALAATKALLAATDAVANGVVAYTMDTNMDGLGAELALTQIASASNNPAIVLLLSVVILAAVVVVWAAMMIRKMLIIIAAVMAPLAFSGATSDLTRGWVRKWVEFTAAMIASKLLLVVIFMVGVSVLQGAGRAPHAGVGQDLTQLVIGALILLLGGFAPWIAIRMFHFAGDHLATAHGYAGQATAGGHAVASAPAKIGAATTTAAKLHGHHTMKTSASRSGGGGPHAGTTGSDGGSAGLAQAKGHPPAHNGVPNGSPAPGLPATGTAPPATPPAQQAAPLPGPEARQPATEPDNGGTGRGQATGNHHPAPPPLTEPDPNDPGPAPPASGNRRPPDAGPLPPAARPAPPSDRQQPPDPPDKPEPPQPPDPPPPRKT